MRLAGVILTAALLFLLGAHALDSARRVSTPPLRSAGDTRSRFCWGSAPARFPQAASFEWRVTGQHRAEPNPWEVGWLVIGQEGRFLAFVPKATGWHLEVFEAQRGRSQRFLASAEAPPFPIGEWQQVTMLAWEGGIFVVAEGELLLDWRWSWAEPAPTWWGEPGRGGLYLEDCVVEVR